MPDDELTDEEKAAREAEENAAAAKREQEALDREARYAKETEARIRAEAERDALKNFVSQQAQTQAPQWTDEQWAAHQEKTGQTKEAFLASASVAQQMIEAKSKEWDAKHQEALTRAQKAEDRAAKLETARGTEGVKSEFYGLRPALARYKNHVEDYLSDFPDEVKNDPVKLKSLLVKAETYVKGVVGEKMQKSSGGGPRFSKDDGGDIREEAEIDTEGLNKNEAQFVRESLVVSPERKKEYEAHLRDSKTIIIGGEEEWMAVRDSIRKQFGRNP